MKLQGQNITKHVRKQIKKNLLFYSVLVLFILFNANGWSQVEEFDQFYYSNVYPPELNENTEEKVRDLYADYQNRYGEKTKVDIKNFVYEYSFFLDRLNRSGDIFYGDEISLYLNELKDSIIKDTYLRGQVRIYLTAYPYFNAFTNDFGSVYVNIGAIAHVDSEEELMYLLAHEIGHVLLRHSHKSIEQLEENKKKWKRDLYNTDFERHQFSQTQELQADSMAYGLLNDRVDPRHCQKLIDQLNVSSNPIKAGKVDFQLLCGHDPQLVSWMEKLWLATENDTVFFEVAENDSLSTHPSIARRQEYMKELVGDKRYMNSYSPTGKLSRVQYLTDYLMLDAYMEHGMYSYLLDHVIKLREQADNDYLKEKQVQALTALSQQKYVGNVHTTILNLYGNALKDQDFLRFRKILLEISALDVNILSAIAINGLRFSSETESFAVMDAAKKNYQFLYQSFPKLFKKDSMEVYRYADYNELERLLYADQDSITSEEQTKRKKALRGKNREDLEDTEELKTEGYHYIESVDTSVMLQRFVQEFPIDSIRNGWLHEARKLEVSREDWVHESELQDVFIAPHLSVYYFRRGKFFQSYNFDPKKKTVLVISENLFFNSKSKRKYQVNFERSFELDNQMADLYFMYPEYDLDLSNRSKTGVTVQDNYLHRLLNRYMDEISSSETIVYAPSYAEVKKKLSEKGMDYLVYRICVVDRNKGTGPKYYLNYYEIYYDIHTQGVVYLSKIASKSKPNKFQLEQLIYLTNKNREQAK